MPLQMGEPVSASVVFDKTQYGDTEPITFQVVVEGAGERQVTFAGSVAVNAQPVAVSGETTVVRTVEYGPFHADGYTVVQDETDPSRYTATPVEGAA